MSRRDLTDRFNAVKELLSSGYSPSGAAYETSVRFNVGLRQAPKYVERALAVWAEEEVEMRGKRRLQIRAVAQNLFRQCYEQDKWMPALHVVDLLCKLDGLYEREIVVHEHSNPMKRPLDEMTSGEKRKRLEELFAKANAARAKAV